MGVKIVSQKEILKAELFDVKEVTIELSNGKKRTHRIAERRPIVAVLPLSHSYEVFLVSQYRYLLNTTTLEAMAGHINRGESPLSGAKRELKEETGISANQWEEIARIQMSGSVFKSIVHVFLAKDLEEGVAQPDEGEEIKTVKMPLSAAVDKVMSLEINHAASMIGILMLDRLRRAKKL